MICFLPPAAILPGRLRSIFSFRRSRSNCIFLKYFSFRSIADSISFFTILVFLPASGLNSFGSAPILPRIVTIRLFEPVYFVFILYSSSRQETVSISLLKSPISVFNFFSISFISILHSNLLLLCSFRKLRKSCRIICGNF
ncbi:MAG: hypothetical protein BWY60_00343 [Actinobacteria bacterium ADurb.Bin346]|nr:MAG: hypothetical protein BWY60_00343 [Actinobacteria bacterium ADurb.Bin346]